MAKIALFHPGLIGQAFSIFLGAKIRLDNSGPNLSDCAEISFLATEPASQGLGIGTQIVEKGLNSLQLLSPNAKGCFVKTSSSNAKKFYEGLGFRPYGEEIRGGKTFEILIVQKSLHSQEPNSKRKSCIN
ncbi:MAG: GNAT family N-acetyltransferase [Nitrospinales bacterium]